MSLFDGIDDAKLRQRREYLRPGRYVCRVNALQSGMTRKKMSFFVAELEIVHVIDGSAGLADVRGPMRVGDQPGWMVMANWDSFLSTVKTIIMALSETTNPNEVTKEVVELSVSSAQPFAGTFLEIDCKNVVSEKKDAAGNTTTRTFTRVDPVRTWTREEVLAKVPPAVAASLGV